MARTFAVTDRGYRGFRESCTREAPRTPSSRTRLNKHTRTGRSRRSVAPLGPDAEAGHRLGDELVVPDDPVALTEFDAGLSPLVLAYVAPDDPLVLVVVALELPGVWNSRTRATSAPVLQKAW